VQWRVGLVLNGQMGTGGAYLAAVMPLDLQILTGDVELQHSQ